MGLKFQPKPGMVLICDFRGFEEPEMVKRRPVVVVASNPDTDQLVTVVPLSKSPPQRYRAWHYALTAPLVPLSGGAPIWAKCDILHTFSTARLDPIRITRNYYAAVQMAPVDYAGVHRAVRAWLRKR
jgi:uncharacterized protein YifN (PemK superfamily)